MSMKKFYNVGMHGSFCCSSGRKDECDIWCIFVWHLKKSVHLLFADFDTDIFSKSTFLLTVNQQSDERTRDGLSCLK